MKRKLRRLKNKLCVGLRAVAHIDDSIKGRPDKFTRAALIVALPLMAAATPIKAGIFAPLNENNQDGKTAGIYTHTGGNAFWSSWAMYYYQQLMSVLKNDGNMNAASAMGQAMKKAGEENGDRNGSR